MNSFLIICYLNLILILCTTVRVFLATKTIEIIIYSGLFSILSVVEYLLFNAADVAITEASVGAYLNSIFALKALSSFKKESYPTNNNNDKNYINIALFGCFLTIFLIFFYQMSGDFKAFTTYNSTLYNEAAIFYIHQVRDFLQFPNIVTAILASFRGYDTLIETLVIFTAGLAVSLLLPKKEIKESEIKKSSLFNKKIIANSMIFLIPFIVIFAFYIQAHGEESPGGGFQSGSILAAAIILYSLIISETLLVFHIKIQNLLRVAAIGALLYLVVGLVPLLIDKNYLNHSFLLCGIDSNESCWQNSQKLAITLLELGVGITVFATMTNIFFSLKFKKD